MAAEAHELEREGLSPAGRLGSRMSELGANMASLAVPGGLAVRAPLSTATVGVPVWAQGIESGMDPTSAIVRGLVHMALMEGVGQLRIPGLSAPVKPAAQISAAITEQAAVRTGGMALAKGVALDTAKGAAVGAIKGPAMTYGGAGLDQATQQIDPNTPQSEPDPVAAAGDFAVMEIAQALAGRAGRAATIGNRLREARDTRMTQWQANQPETVLGQPLPPRETRGPVAQQMVEAKGAEYVKAQQEAQAEFEAAQARANPPQEADVSMPQEPFVPDAGYAARAEAEARARLSAQPIQLGRRPDPGAQAEARMAEAEDYRNVQQEQARTIMEQQRLDAGQAEANAELAAPRGPGLDPDVVAARREFDTARTGLMERGGVERARAAQERLRQAIQTAEDRAGRMEAENAPVIEPPAPPTPQELHQQEVARIREAYRTGAMTPQMAVEARAAADRTLETPNAPPPSIPEGQKAPVQEGRAPAQGTSQGVPGGPIDRSGGNPPPGEVRAPTPQVQGQGEVRSPQEPVVRQGDGVPQPAGEVIPEPAMTPARANTQAALHGVNGEAKASPTVAAVAPEVTPIADRIASREKSAVNAPTTMGGPVRSWTKRLQGVFGAFQGNKARAMPMMAEATVKTMTEPERAGITHTVDLFGGSGSAGLMHRLINFPSAGVHVLNERAQPRLEKIRMVQTMTPTELRRRVNELGIEQDVKNAIAEAGHSGGGVSGRLETMLVNATDPATGKLRDPSQAEYYGLLQLFADHLPRKGTGKAREIAPEKVWQDAASAVYQYAKSAHELAQLAKKQGVQIEYRNEDAYTTEIPQGKQVHVIADVPYFATAGYSGEGRVGVDTYKRTGDLIRRLRDNGNHAMYTDEAWWTRKAPDEPEWRDGAKLREGAEVLKDIHNEVTTMDVHRVGDRNEVLATVHPDKRSAPRAEKPLESRAADKPAEPTPAEGQTVSPETVTRTVAPAVSPAETPAGQWVRTVMRAVASGITGKSVSGETLPKSPTLGEGLQLRAASDNTIEVISPNGETKITTIHLAPPLAPKSADPVSWFRSTDKNTLPRRLVKAGLDVTTAQSIRTVDDFVNKVPIKVKEKLFGGSPTPGVYDPATGKTTLHVRPNEALDLISRTGNHEIEHAVVDNLMPQADKDIALADMQKRKVPGVDKMSADPKAGRAYTDFLEAMRQLNEKWSPERAKVGAAVKSMEAETGLRGVLTRLARSIREFWTGVKIAADSSPQGLDLVFSRLRAGEYSNLTPRDRTAPGEAKPGEKAMMVDEETGETRGEIQPISGIEGERAKFLIDRATEVKNVELKDRTRRLDEGEAKAQEFINNEHGGNAVKAAKAILRQGGAQSIDEMYALKLAANAIDHRAGWSRESLRLMDEIGARLAKDLSLGAQIMSHSRGPRTPEEKLNNIVGMFAARSERSVVVMDRLQEDIRTAAPEEKAALQAQYDTYANNNADRALKYIALFKEKYGIDLSGEGAANYMTDDAMVQDIVSLACHEMRKKGEGKFASFYRAALLSNVLQTESQQLISNTASLAFYHNPAAAALRGSMSGTGAWAGASIALRSLFTRNLYLTAIKNGAESFIGRKIGDENTGRDWEAPKNVHVQGTMNVELGRMDDPMQGRNVSHKGLVMAPLTFLAHRPMAFLDGAANRMSGTIHEAEMYYKLQKELGATHDEAIALAQGVLEGKVEVPHDMKVEAIFRSLPTTFQDLAIARKGLPGGSAKTLRHGIDALQQVIRFLDHAIPLSGKNEFGEQSFAKIGTVLVPFLRTGMAMARVTAKGVPLTSLLYMGLRKATGKYEGPNGQYEKAQDMTTMLMGWAAQAAVMAGVSSGALTITGTESDDVRKKMRAEGSIATGEYVLKAFGIEVPFSRMEPFATMLAAMGNAANAFHRGDGASAAMWGQVQALSRMGAGLSWFKTANDIRDALTPAFGYRAQTDPSVGDKIVERFMLEPAVSLWPAFFRGLNPDPERREYPEVKGVNPLGWEPGESMSTDHAWEAARLAKDYILQRTQLANVKPISDLTGTKPAGIKRTAEGKPESDAAGESYVGAAIRGGFGRQPTDTSTDFSRAFDDYRMKLPAKARDELHLPTFPKDVTERGEKIHLTPDEYERLKENVGGEQAQWFSGLAKTITSLPADEANAKWLAKRINHAHSVALKREKRQIIMDRYRAGKAPAR